MVRRKQVSLLGRLLGGRQDSGRHISDQQIRRVEEKRRAAADATQQWLTLLRDLESKGESGHSTYETYYRAYLQAREQEKRVDLELFNLRQGLGG